MNFIMTMDIYSVIEKISPIPTSFSNYDIKPIIEKSVVEAALSSGCRLLITTEVSREINSVDMQRLYSKYQDVLDMTIGTSVILFIRHVFEQYNNNRRSVSGVELLFSVRSGILTVMVGKNG